jgi:HlyD family secretion protein
MIQGTSAMDRPIEDKRLWSRRVLKIGLPVLVLLLATIFLYGPATRWLSSERSVAISRVRFGEVVRGDLERDLSVQGRIVAAFHPTTFSPASGIVALRVRAGEVVAEDQVLAVVDSPELRSRLEQERSTLSSLESDLDRQKILTKQTILSDRQKVDLATVELEAAGRAMNRADRSREEGIVNEVEYEEAQDDLSRARLALDHARENAALEKETLEFEVRNSELQVERQRLVVTELQRQVDDLLIRAPVSGLVSRLDVDDHDAVVPGQPLVAVVDLSAFEVEILVPESYADEIGPGTPAVIHFAGDQFAGEVKVVSPEVEGSQVRGVVSFSGQAPEGMRQNQRVSTRLVLESRTDVLKVPRGPFLEAGGGSEVYLVQESMAVLHPIRVGSVSVGEVEIVSGLDEGDRIIISDTTRFEKATRVFLRQ